MAAARPARSSCSCGFPLGSGVVRRAWWARAHRDNAGPSAAALRRPRGSPACAHAHHRRLTGYRTFYRRLTVCLTTGGGPRPCTTGTGKSQFLCRSLRSDDAALPQSRDLGRREADRREHAVRVLAEAQAFDWPRAPRERATDRALGCGEARPSWGLAGEFLAIDARSHFRILHRERHGETQTRERAHVVVEPRFVADALVPQCHVFRRAAE